MTTVNEVNLENLCWIDRLTWLRRLVLYLKKCKQMTGELSSEIWIVWENLGEFEILFSKVSALLYLARM